jgi:methyltransferase (TIGR00027 family)
VSSTEDRIRNISDTAIWAAIYRAREDRRKGALFRDPFAERLAGERGKPIAEQMREHDRHDWAWVMRTVLYDRFIAGQIAAGADMVVNLAAGLDARPYRMALPPNLDWIEVDLPDLVDYKARILASETPACRLERVRLDLADVAARRKLFSSLGERSSNALVITEGLLIYLTAEEVAALAEDLAAARGFRHWALEIVSPGLLRMLQREVGDALAQARAPLKFGPPEGPAFFEKHGWKLLSFESPLKAAARARRLPFFLRLVAKFPESSGPQGNRPWSGICLFEKF